MKIGFNLLLWTTAVRDDGRALPGLAAATRVWRDVFDDADEVWREGLRPIRHGWAAA